MAPLRGVQCLTCSLVAHVLASMGSLLVASRSVLFTPMYFCFISKTRASSECCPSCCILGVDNASSSRSKTVVAQSPSRSSHHRGPDSPPHKCRTSSPPLRSTSNVSVSCDIEIAPSLPPTMSPLLLPCCRPRHSAFAALLLLTCLLLGAPLAL